MTGQDRLEILICFIGGIFFLYRAHSHGSRLSKILNTPTTLSQNARSGFIELQGFAWPKENRFVRTVGNRDAVYYSLYVEEYQYSLRDNGLSPLAEAVVEADSPFDQHEERKWVRTYSYHHHHAFFVLDPAGIVEVDPNAFTELVITERSSRYFNDLTSDEQVRLRAMAPSVFGGAMIAPAQFHGVRNGISVSGGQRITEEEILVGSPILASGHFVSCAHEGRSVAARELSDFAVSKFDPLRLFYKDPAALINFTVLGRLVDTAEEKLFIANRHEGPLIRRLKKQDWLSFCAAIALFAFGIYLAT